ncbi:MAG TPA: hypothetical protein PLW10_10820 [Myxococcota bacterium]|nr:hypothetical protein [Myxococcota bacterium]
MLTGVTALAVAAAPTSALAGEKAAEVGRESGLGAAAAVSSLVYAPVKLVYATGGLIVGAFAWAFTAGDNNVAGKVFTRSLRGTYVITPEILRGEERLEFIGRDVDSPTAPTAAVAAARASQPASPPAYESGSESDYDSSYDDMGW